MNEVILIGSCLGAFALLYVVVMVVDRYQLSREVDE